MKASKGNSGDVVYLNKELKAALEEHCFQQAEAYSSDFVVRTERRRLSSIYSGAGIGIWALLAVHRIQGDTHLSRMRLRRFLRLVDLCVMFRC